jgi:hypothetical protein
MKTTIPRERTATAAELADEATRAERARTDRQLPRTLHALCEQAARLVNCGHCWAGPVPCATAQMGITWPGSPGPASAACSPRLSSPRSPRA